MSDLSQSSAIIQPARNIVGSLRLPGDKSISHRYAMLAAIAEGTTRLENYSTGMDCASTLACLRGLGVEWRRNEDGVVEICGRGPKLKAPTAALEISPGTVALIPRNFCPPAMRAALPATLMSAPNALSANSP